MPTFVFASAPTSKSTFSPSGILGAAAGLRREAQIQLQGVRNVTGWKKHTHLNFGFSSGIRRHHGDGRQREREQVRNTKLGMEIKGIVHQEFGGSGDLSDPHNRSGVSQRDTVPASASTAEACAGHGLQCKKIKK